MTDGVAFVDMPLIRRDTVEQRDYQIALAEVASKQSTMIVLSTGLGKTVIAAFVAAKQLVQYPDGKVLFLAPSRPLVDQQARFLRRVMDIEEDLIVRLTGHDSPEDRQRAWMNAKVIVMTPQAVQNDLIQMRYELSDVVLIVYDEAHRGMGDYAYTFIAEMYERQGKHQLSLGLTASPGHDTEKISTVCSNLRLKHIEVRTTSSKDVRPYVVSITDYVRYVTLPPQIEELREILRDLLREYTAPVLNYGYSLPDARRLSRKEILRVQLEIRKELGTYTKPPRHLYILMRNLTASLRIEHLLDFIGTQGIEPTYRYVQGMYEEARNKKASKGVQDLISRVEFRQFENLLQSLIDKGFRHPKVDELIEIVSEQLSANLDSRILVFTRFRDTAIEVATALEELEDARVSRFVGQSSRGQDKGFTQKKQIEVLDAFRNNEYNILVATQVGEEGLDIPECNLVVFYDCVPSVVPFIQRRGRTGRKLPGRSVILVARNTHDEFYYWSVFSKLKRMPSALKDAERETSGKKEAEKSTIAKTAEQLSLEEFSGSEDETSSTQSTDSSVARDREKIKIIVDSRELATAVARELTRLGVEITTETLQIGDYIASEEVAVERKETGDFVQSLIDGRLFVQLTALRAAYRRPVLIIEGDQLIGLRAVNPTSIYGALAAIAIKIQVPIIWSHSAEETANLLYRIAHLEQVEAKRPIRTRTPETKSADARTLEYILSGFPGIDTIISRGILEEFGTLQRVFQASEEELKRVRGVGPKTAERIRRILTMEYPSYENKTKDNNE